MIESSKKSIDGLPSDVIPYIPEKAARWLGQYGITQEEISKNRFQWSEERQMLIMPVYDIHDNLLMWQGRNFKLKKVPLGENTTLATTPELRAEQLKRGYTVEKDGPKYHTQGDSGNILHIIQPLKGVGISIVVVTEDLISAIKVGRVWPAMPLWGSHMGLEQVRRLKMQFWSLGIWLDEDKATSAVKMACRASQVMPTFVVTSTRDPKYYPEDMIHKMVHHAGKNMVDDALKRMEQDAVAKRTEMDIAEVVI